jgi:glucuronate isomerase
MLRVLTQTARTLYHDFAENMPIFDYHCHLPVAEIAENKNFKDLTDIWLRGAAEHHQQGHGDPRAGHRLRHYK